jgi:hypothetical protein
MHVCSAHKTHVRASCDATITGLPAPIYKGTALKGIAWIDTKCTYNGGKIAIQKLFHQTIYFLLTLILICTVLEKACFLIISCA